MSSTYCRSNFGILGRTEKMKPRFFLDRTDAGRLLASKLVEYANRPDVLILGNRSAPDFDETRAIEPLERTAQLEAGEVPETFPLAVMAGSTFQARGIWEKESMIAR